MTDPLAAADSLWMKEALIEAEKARVREEVPVGALLVRDGQVIGRGHNVTEQRQDPTVHAEMMAIRQGAAVSGSRRLLGATLYVTLEPCAMCAGAILLAKVRKLFYGAPDPKTGAVTSCYQVLEDSRSNHQTEVHTGILEIESRTLLETFFKNKRTYN